MDRPPACRRGERHLCRVCSLDRKSTFLSRILVATAAKRPLDTAAPDGHLGAMDRDAVLAASSPPPTAVHSHSRLEDAQGIVFGSVMGAFGPFLLGSAGLITGQLAGLALLIAQVTGWGFGPVYLVLSLPFYGFGYKRMGLGFLRRTIAAVLLMVATSMLLPRLIAFDTLHPGAAAVLAGFVAGAGLLALFRHRTSLGGIGAVALDLQDRLGVKAGWVQMGFDAALFAAALAVLPLDRVLWSAMGAAVLNVVIAINHRRDRYIV